MPPSLRGTGIGLRKDPPLLYRIELDMMLKGSVSRRRGRDIRQFCVMVDGAPRIVTNGDVVDDKTYCALVAAGAVIPREATFTGPESPDTRPESTE